MLSTCNVHRALLCDVVAKLTEIEELSKGEGTEDKLQTAMEEKERAIVAWVRHHREHGC